jgi:hypothetical protein
MDFEEALHRLGFAAAKGRSGGTKFYEARPNRYLTYSVHAYDDGTALFSWEFAIAEYLATRGLQVGSNEELNTYLYPRADLRGPQDGRWLAESLDRTEETLRSIRFDAPEE